MRHRFHQVDVFAAGALQGNPLAVVHAADGVDDATMATFARWTNLSETTFLLAPTDDGADYRVRIWTPGGELPFAGHPTLGSCHAWLAAGGRPRRDDEVVQQCGVGLVRIRRDTTAARAHADGVGRPGRLAFAAPPLRRGGPLGAALRARLVAALGVDEADVLGDQWVDNGPGWCALRLCSADAVRAARPDWGRLGDAKVGLVGAHAPGHDAAFELRALIGRGDGTGYEDPVTGSLNASVAQWLIGSGVAPPRYVASQGARLQRDGRVHIERSGDTVWVGGDVVVVVDGEVGLR